MAWRSAIEGRADSGMGCCASSVAVRGEPEPEPEIHDDCWHRAQGMFQTVDADGSGHLDREEVGKLFELLGTPLVESELIVAMRKMDKDGGGTVDFAEFYQWYKVVSEKEEEGKGVWLDEPDEVQRATPALPSAPAGPAPQRGSGRRVHVSPPEPSDALPKGSAVRRATTTPPPELNLSETPASSEPESPKTSGNLPPTRRQRLCNWCVRTRKKNQRDECRELFDQIDEDGSGLLDVSEIVKLAKLLGVSLTSAQAQQAMDEMDDDGSGEVDFEEFFLWFKSVDESASSHRESMLGKRAIKWAEHEQRRATILGSAQRNSSILSHAITGQHSVEEMRKSQGMARVKEG